MSARRVSYSLGALAGALALVVAGCSSGGGDSSPSSVTGGNYSVAIEDAETLVPTNCYEVYCATVLSVLYTGLVTFEPNSSGAYEPELTELTASIATTDNGKTWTITLNDGFTFSDGEKVTAQSFVDTWNFAANGGNGQELGFVFGPSALDVEGYEAVAGEKVTGKKMSGLKVDKDDPLVFTVTLNTAIGEGMFYNLVGGPAVLPMSSKALADPDSQNTRVIGNGPYMMAEDRSTANIKVVKNPNYAGAAPNADGIDFRVYEDSNASWTDLQSNELDLLPEMPSSAVLNAPTVLGDRFINQPGGMSYQYFGFSTQSKTFAKKDVRLAIAKAINWQEINEKFWANTRSVATSFAPSSIPGGGTDLCGDSCTFDVAQAKKLLADAGGLPGGSVQIASLAGDSSATREAVCNQLQSNLEIKCTLKPLKNFGAYLDLVYGEDVPDNLIMAAGWTADNPTIQSMISLFTTDFGNEMQYGNPKVDKLIAEGNEATSAEEQQQKWIQAEKLILDDFYAYPTQSLNVASGYSENITNVVMSPFGMPNLTQIQVTG